MLHCDLSNSSLIRFFFKLRGVSTEVYSIEHFTNIGFMKLDEEPGKEILCGMVVINPMLNTFQSNISSKEFIQKADGNIIKAVINFWQRISAIPGISFLRKQGFGAAVIQCN